MMDLDFGLLTTDFPLCVTKLSVPLVIPMWLGLSLIGLLRLRLFRPTNYVSTRYPIKSNARLNL